MTSSDQQRFSELLPFYVNGTLNAADQAFVRDFLEKNPTADVGLRFTKLLQNNFRQIGAQRSESEGLSRLLGDLATESMSPRKPPALRLPNLIERFTAWCHQWGFTPAFTVAALIVIVQGGVLFSLGSDATKSDISGYRGSREITPIAGPVLKAVFKPTAEFAAVVDLLQVEGASIIQGPDESGAVLIRLHPNIAAEHARQRLMTSGLLDDVTIVKEVP